MTQTQENLVLVLSRITAMVEENEDDSAMFADKFIDILDTYNKTTRVILYNSLTCNIHRDIIIILEKLSDFIKTDEDAAMELSDILDYTLTDILESDGFGTEGQNDPRGDFRDGYWSMYNVQFNKA